MLSRALLAVAIVLSPATLWAQSETLEVEDQGHWATAAFFGTGWYRVDKQREAFVFRVPPRQVLSRSAWKEDGTRQLGIEIHYPVTLGLHQIDEVPDFIEFDNYGTISFTPGIELEIPVSERWHLRPYAHLGVGYERKSGDWAGIWYGGLKSRYRLDEDEATRWSLLNALTWSGFNPESGSAEQYASVMAGFEYNRRLARRSPGSDPVWLNAHLTYSYLLDQLNFSFNPLFEVSIRDEWEIGLALGLRDRKIRIAFLGFEQLGLSYKTSSNGDYRAITFNLRSPFTL